MPPKKIKNTTRKLTIPVFSKIQENVIFCEMSCFCCVLSIESQVSHFGKKTRFSHNKSAKRRHLASIESPSGEII